MHGPRAQRPDTGVDSGGQTRERLLDVAERLFASRGFAATSVRRITRDAACNLAAFNYHFGSKLGLYEEVFRRRLEAVRDQRLAAIRRAATIQPGPGALEEVLYIFASSFIEPLVGESHGRMLTELMGREMLDPHLPPEMFRGEIAGPVQEALTQALCRTTPGLSVDAARLCVQSITGQLVQTAQRVRRQSATPMAGPPLTIVVDHIVRFSAAGVRASVGGAPAGSPHGRPQRS
ncbi:MAG TPA: CerR family C-terminal domain-containing protein [Thermoanaerobaculaceae bacterium]|nr:CerR family C-terminal domain-containing protein [Thermoanaerobaculaceae bacterium]